MTDWDPNYFQKDEETLKELGYKQQLQRNLGPIHSFGVSFSIISVTVSITTLFAYSLETGGPGTMTISWVVVSFFSCFIALSMAEIVSALPMSGGPYFWAATLAPSKYSSLASWITGWFNILGLVSTNTSLAYGLTQLISTAASVKTDYVPTQGRDLGMCSVILLSWAAMNTIGRPLLRHLLYFSIALNSFGLIAFAVAVLIKAPTYQKASFIFTSFIDDTGPNPGEGWATRASPAYVACIGSYIGLYTFFGYDASAHLAEETLRASWIAPLGIITAVGLSTFFGFFLIVALLLSIQDLNSIVNSPYNNAVLQILIDIFGDNGALALFALPIMCTWHCGLFLTTSNSRIIWAFSRDHGIPYFFSKINERLMSPVRAVGLATVLSFALCASSLGSIVAFTAATSIATIGVLTSYGIPIFLKLIYHREFCLRKGPFQLGFASRPISLVSTGWIVFSCVVLSLPTSTPVTRQTLNYGPLAVAVTAVWAIGLWLLRATRSFVGPATSPNPSDISNLMTGMTIKT